MSVLQQAAILQVQLVLAACGQALVVGDQYQGGAVLTVEGEHQLADMRAGVVVEIAGRFIGKQDVRLGGKGPGQGYTLLFAAGELPRIVMQALAQADSLKQCAGLLAGIGVAFQL